jgi:transposase
MHRTIQTTYRYRLDPTVEQEAQLCRFAGARRFVWNWALNRKRQHFRQTGKTLKFSALCAELTRLKQQPATAWLREIDSQSLQQTLRDLENAYQHFFRRARNGDKKKGFPKFKSRKTDTPRFRIPQRVVLIDAFVSVPKIGMIKAIVHRPPHGITKSATFKREPALVSHPNPQAQARTKGAQSEDHRQSQPRQGADRGGMPAPEDAQPAERLSAQTEYRYHSPLRSHFD